MGTKCCNKTQALAIPLVKEEITDSEISIPTYTSEADKEFLKIETKFNYLRDIQFSDYIYMLTQFSMETATVKDDFSKAPKTYSKNEPYYNEPWDNDYFQSFIENKILKHPNLYTKAGENEAQAEIFKDILWQMHKPLQTKLAQHWEKNGEEDTLKSLKKCHGMTYGLLYCSGKNITKIKFLFDLFAENNTILKSNELNNFLLALFLLPAYCAWLARKKVGSKHDEVGKLEDADLKRILDACELKDSVHWVDVANSIIFNNFESLNYEQWKVLFGRKENSMGWLLTPKGIRHMLQENNV